MKTVQVISLDEALLEKGRGPDKQPRKKRGGVRVGDIIYHPRWGSGDITRIENGKAEVTFKMRSPMDERDWKRETINVSNVHEVGGKRFGKNKHFFIN